MKPLQMLFSIILVLVLTTIAAALYSGFENGHAPAPAITDFASCAAAGNPVMESYPRQCSAGGHTFTEVIPAATSTGADMPAAANGCVVSGCSSELCVDATDAGVVSSCVYRPEYACYASAVCERQASGECGWTPTPALEQCLADAEASSSPAEASSTTVLEVQ